MSLNDLIPQFLNQLNEMMNENPEMRNAVESVMNGSEVYNVASEYLGMSDDEMMRETLSDEEIFKGRVDLSHIQQISQIMIDNVDKFDSEIKLHETKKLKEQKSLVSETINDEPKIEPVDE